MLLAEAGKVGLTAARVCETGRTVRVIDSRAGPLEYSEAIGVMPRVPELLDRFDLAGPMVADCSALKGIERSDWDGRWSD